MSYDANDDPNKMFRNKVFKKVLEDNKDIIVDGAGETYVGEKVENTIEIVDLKEGGKLELVEVQKWNGNTYRVAYGQIFKHTPKGSRLPFYMNHNYSICEHVFNDLKKQFTGEKK